jgi:putative effector of murein hydrolase LrgA (UPF0299 family)
VSGFNVQSYNKFVVALVGLLALYLQSRGVDGVEELSDQAIALLTALGVFFVPNR